MIRPTDEGYLVRDTGEVADEIRDHQPTFRIEPHEDTAPVDEKRHLVRVRRKRIFRRDLTLEPLQEIRTADTDRRKHKVLEAIELLNIALRQHGSERRRHGNPALGIDPVGRI